MMILPSHAATRYASVRQRAERRREIDITRQEAAEDAVVDVASDISLQHTLYATVFFF